MKLIFHGVRGSLPVCSPDVNRYGGNTTCMELQTDSGERLVVDGGTGIRTLGSRLGESGACNLVLTHEHWDHILGLPFFAPLYNPNWHVTLHVPRGCGGVLHRLMDGVAFPIRVTNLAATIRICEFCPGDRLNIDGMQVETFAMPHPGGSVGLRLTADGVTLALSGDCEIDPNSPEIEKVRALFEGADGAVVDGQYGLEQYPTFRGWGHSFREVWVGPAVEAGIRRLVFTHHDVDSTDDMLDARQAGLRECFAAQSMHLELAYEGLTLVGGASHD